ncbi:MAG TPA: hypothetical protein VER17_01660 [Tepidisphaeraceae bacterium]|nr:hypothetical protein [Tepidisphaeraceae bacterium]
MAARKKTQNAQNTKSRDKTDHDRTAHGPRTPGGKPGPVEGRAPDQSFEQGAPPEATNYQHPTAEGLNRSVPGAGVVGHDVDSPGATRGQNVPGARRNSPGADRAGTTRSGPASMPAGDGVGATADDRLDNEPNSAGGGAPLSTETGGTGAPRPGPAYGAPEADAASAGPNAEKGQAREKRFREERGL